MDVDVIDIGLFCKPSDEKSTPSDTQKFQLLTNHFKPDGDSKVPLAYQDVKKAGKNWKVYFQMSWLKEYPWLVYLPSQKGGFCKYCALYAQSSNTSTFGVLVKLPFTKLTHAKGRDADDDFFPNIRRLIIMGCTSPVTSCEAERSFSALRRVKTYLRSTMGEERLAALTLMAIHYQETLKLDPTKVVQCFM